MTNLLKILILLFLLSTLTGLQLELTSSSPEQCLLFYSDGYQANRPFDFEVPEEAFTTGLEIFGLSLSHHIKMIIRPAALGSGRYRLMVDNHSHPKLKMCFRKLDSNARNIRIRLLLSHQKPLHQDTISTENTDTQNVLQSNIDSHRTNLLDLGSNIYLVYWIAGLIIYALIFILAFRITLRIRKQPIHTPAIPL